MSFNNIQPQMSKPQDGLPQSAPGPDQPALPDKLRQIFSNTHIDWTTIENIPEVKLHAEKIENLLQNLYAKVEKRIGKELLDELSNFVHQNSSIIFYSPRLYTKVHQFFDFAADRMQAEGNIEASFKLRSMAASLLHCSPYHPLYRFSSAIEENKLRQKTANYGAFFSGLDSSALKGGNFRADTRKLDGNDVLWGQFKLSYFARDKWQKTLTAIRNNPSLFEKLLPDNLIGKVIISTVPYTFPSKNADGTFSSTPGYTPEQAEALQIEFPGIGKVIVGNSADYLSLYNDVNVYLQGPLKDGESLETLQKMLTVLGCGPVLGVQDTENDDRMKIAQLFRTFYPRKAIEFERTESFYKTPLPQLIATIEKEVPEMMAIFNRYLREKPELMRKVEIFPGKTIWSVTDLSEKMKEKGAWGLMSALVSNPEKCAETIAKLLKIGSLSSMDRFQIGAFIEGASSQRDLYCGGGDYVFTRLITQNFSENLIKNFRYAERTGIMILYDLKAVSNGSYGYEEDFYGVKFQSGPNPIFEDNYYAHRLNLIELVNSVTMDNEIMIKNHVEPEFIKGIVVNSEEQKQIILAELRSQGLITSKGGTETIMGKPINEFIHISEKFTKAMWD